MLRRYLIRARSTSMRLLRHFFFVFFATQITCCQKCDLAAPPDSKGTPASCDTCITPVTIMPFDTTNLASGTHEYKFVPWEENKPRYNTLLGIGDIRNENNEVEIRIWVSYAFCDSLRIIVLKHCNNKWQSIAYNTKPFFDDDRYVEDIYRRVETNEPISGWKSFLANLDSIGIYKLKNYDDIPEYYLCNDGNFLEIEIWRNGVYKQFEYPCLEAELGENEIQNEVKRVTQIYLLIEKEFGYKVFDPQAIWEDYCNGGVFWGTITVP
jgi:hypothetical protein